MRLVAWIVLLCTIDNCQGRAWGARQIFWKPRGGGGAVLPTDGIVGTHIAILTSSSSGLMILDEEEAIHTYPSQQPELRTVDILVVEANRLTSELVETLRENSIKIPVLILLDETATDDVFRIQLKLAAVAKVSSTTRAELTSRLTELLRHQIASSNPLNLEESSESDTQSSTNSSPLSMNKSNELDELYQQLEQAIHMAMAHDLADLETVLEDCMLEHSILNFGEFANPMLSDLQAGLDGLPDDFGQPIVQKVGNYVQGLWKMHMETLRDYFGIKYEELMDKSNADEWTEQAQAATEAFRQVAEDSIPELARPNEIFQDFDLEYVSSLQGLLSDMMEATSARQDEISLEESLNQDDSTPATTHVWLRKVTARALVWAVNYAQGWLAWQGVKRAALDRERQMPKFPLL